MNSNPKQAAKISEAKREKNKKKREKRNKGKSAKSGLPIEAAAVAYSQKQVFAGRSNRSRRIQKSEFIASITGSTTFDASQKFYLNPGLPASFPWLSGIAEEWQQYRFHYLRFRYVTRSPTSSKGSVILSPDYNPKEASPTTELQASNTQDAVEDVVWKELTCTLDPSAMFPFGPRKQVRTAAVAGDISLYDAGRMFVCVTGEADASEIGKLWVDYDVELFVPQNSPTLYLNPAGTSLYSNSGLQTVSTGVQATIIYDVTLYDALNIGEPAAGVFTPPAGCYNIAGYVTGFDNTNESFLFGLTVYKNGSPIRSEELSCQGRTGATGSNGLITLPINDVVSCNGTDTVTVRATLTGVTGGLSINDKISLIWRLA